MGILGSGSSHLAGAYGAYGKKSGGQQNKSVVRCQKCLQMGHYTYECQNEATYKARPSRTQQLKNPKLRQGFLAAEELPPELNPGSKKDKDKKEKEKKRRRSPSPSSSCSSGSSTSGSESSSSGSDGSSSSGSSSSSSSGSSSGSGSSSSSSSSSGSDSDSDSGSGGSRRRKSKKSRR